MDKLTEKQKMQIITLYTDGFYTGQIAEKLRIPEYLIVRTLEDNNMYGYTERNREAI